MEEKLKKLYKECIDELKTINIDILDNQKIGLIDIKIAPRNAKRYGCCKHDKPDQNSYSIIKKGRYRIKKYEKFREHHIEISKWVLDLNESVIKNTIMHEIIHCFPYCNNHGKMFKSYASLINQKLGYNISRLGDKEKDFKESNLEYNESTKNYKYKIICKKCGTITYRQRLQRNLIKNYRCAKCGGKLELTN